MNNVEIPENNIDIEHPHDQLEKINKDQMVDECDIRNFINNISHFSNEWLKK